MSHVAPVTGPVVPFRPPVAPPPPPPPPPPAPLPLLPAATLASPLPALGGGTRASALTFAPPVPPAAPPAPPAALPALPAPDAGRTWGGPGSPRALNFGHLPGGEGALFAWHPSGALVWADNGRAVTPAQWVNMPAAQQARIREKVPAAGLPAFLAHMATGDPREARREPPAAPADRGADPRAWFISQYPGPTNPREDVARNGNCGPTSVLMCAVAFGKTRPTPAQVDDTIEAVRKRAGASREQRAGHGAGTSLDQLARAARSYGLGARVMGGVGVAGIEAQLARGRLVVALVRPGHYTRSGASGHYVVVTRVANGQVHLNDPMMGAPITVPVAAFSRAVGALGGNVMAVAPR